MRALGEIYEESKQTTEVLQELGFDSVYAIQAATVIQVRSF